MNRSGFINYAGRGRVGRFIEREQHTANPVTVGVIVEVDEGGPLVVELTVYQDGRYEVSERKQGTSGQTVHFERALKYASEER